MQLEPLFRNTCGREFRRLDGQVFQAPRLTTVDVAFLDSEPSARSVNGGPRVQGSKPRANTCENGSYGGSA